MTMTTANKITILRIFTVPFFVISVLYYSPEKDYLRLVALAIFIFAIISDGLDGYIARKFNQQTKVGAMLDPLADKLLLVSAFICLYKVGVMFEFVRFPLWLVVAVISRDVILLLGAVVIHFLQGDLTVEPSMIGKVTTFFQMMSVVTLLLQWEYSLMIWMITAALVGYTLVDYMIKGVNILGGGE